MAIGTFNAGDTGLAVRTKINAAITIVDGLGNISTQAASAVAITGGVITGLTRLGMTGGTNPTASTLGLGTITDTTSRPLGITQTWNNASLAGTALLINVTDTASDAASLLTDLQAGGVSKFSIRKDGLTTINNNLVLGNLSLIYNDGISGAGNLKVSANGGDVSFTSNNGSVYAWGFRSGTIDLHASSASRLCWTDGAITGTPSLILSQANAAVLQLGENHATIATAQTIKAHDVITGTGADLVLSGGTGSVANGKVQIDTNLLLSAMSGGGNRLLVTDTSGNIAALTTGSAITDLSVSGPASGVDLVDLTDLQGKIETLQQAVNDILAANRLAFIIAP